MECENEFKYFSTLSCYTTATAKPTHILRPTQHTTPRHAQREHTDYVVHVDLAHSGVTRFFHYIVVVRMLCMCMFYAQSAVRLHCRERIIMETVCARRCILAHWKSCAAQNSGTCSIGAGCWFSPSLARRCARCACVRACVYASMPAKSACEINVSLASSFWHAKYAAGMEEIIYSQQRTIVLVQKITCAKHLLRSA